MCDGYKEDVAFLFRLKNEYRRIKDAASDPEVDSISLSDTRESLQELFRSFELLYHHIYHCVKCGDCDEIDSIVDHMFEWNE